MESKEAEFLNHYNICRKYRKYVEGIMAEEHGKLMMAAHQHVLSITENNNQIFDKLSKDYKMSPNSVKETMFFGKFLEEFVKLKKLNNKNDVS